MIKSKTVFVIGAGASKEVGFPLGSELKHIISSKLKFKRDGSSGDRDILNHLQHHHGNILNQCFNACRQISEGIVLSDSIDDFIDFHQCEYISLCGKTAIAASILEAEMTSKLYVKPDNTYNTIDFKSVSHTWYAKFYSLLAKQLRKSDIGNIFDNVTIVNFNYDRSLEHFLTHAIAKHTLIDLNEAGSIVNGMKVFRPYGSVGPYFDTISHSIKYGKTGVINTDNLKTYTEQIEDTMMLQIVQEEMKQATAVVFLGMAYHKNNMKLLESDGKDVYGMFGKKIYATRYGFTDSDLPVICRDIGNLQPDKTIAAGKKAIPDNMKFAGTCQELFDMFQKLLAEL